MDLTRVPEHGTMKLSDNIVEFHRKDNVIRVPLTKTFFIDQVVDDAVVTKEITFRATGVATCNPNDKFSLKYGVRRAYRYALEAIEPKVQKAVKRNHIVTPDQQISRELKQVKNELKAMEAKFQRAIEKVSKE